MRLFLRMNGALRRPAPTGDSPDFGTANDGELVVVDGEEVRVVGVYLMAGDDMHPASHSSYDVSLYAVGERLVLRISTDRYRGSEATAHRISDDRGRSWQVVSAPPPLDASQLVDRIAAG